MTEFHKGDRIAYDGEIWFVDEIRTRYEGTFIGISRTYDVDGGFRTTVMDIQDYVLEEKMTSHTSWYEVPIWQLPLYEQEKIEEAIKEALENMRYVKAA